MRRREFLAGAAGLLGAACAPRLALANVPTPYSLDLNPPMDNREKFIAWGVAQRGEDPNSSASGSTVSRPWCATKTCSTTVTNAPSC